MTNGKKPLSFNEIRSGKGKNMNKDISITVLDIDKKLCKIYLHIYSEGKFYFKLNRRAPHPPFENQ